MKVLFINITKHFDNTPDKKHLHPRHVLPPIDVGYCAALLEENGHETLLIDTVVGHFNTQSIREKITEENIDVVVLKPDIKAYQLTLELAKQIKVFCRHIICIGPRVSASPELFIFKESPVDLCIIGEPEFTLLEIIERIEKGKPAIGISGTCHFRNTLVMGSPRQLCYDLDSLPFPKHDLFIDKGYSFQYPIAINSKKSFGIMLTSRGCPHACIFCSPVKRISFGKEYRARSAHNVVDEISLLQSKGINIIYFADDLFTHDRNRVELICNEIVKRKMKVIWAAQIRADLPDFKLLEKMKQAGCGCVNIGIESANDNTLKLIGKGTTKESIEKTVSFCRKVGINTVGDFIIGIPGQTRHDLSENLKFAKSLRLDLAEALLFTPYPGSRAFELFGNPSDIDKYSDYDNATASHCELGVEELRKAQLRFYRSYYFNLGFMVRFFLKNKTRIFNNLSSELAFLKNVFLFLLQG